MLAGDRRRAQLDGGSSLQVVLDLLRVLAVESLQLLVELHVPLVDVVWKKIKKIKFLR